MKIGIPKEIRTNENCVALVSAEAVVSAGHAVLAESGAGPSSDFTDAQSQAAGEQIAKEADAVWAAAGTDEGTQHHRWKSHSPSGRRSIRAGISRC